MKFAFTELTGTHIGERTITPIHNFKHNGLKFFFFDKRIYIDQNYAIKYKYVVLNKYITSYYSLYVELGGHLFYIVDKYNESIQDCEDFVKENIETIIDSNKECLVILNKLESYNDAKKEQRQKTT